MRVLLVNRDDLHLNLGGDTIQMLKTKAALEEIGVEVEACCVSDIDDAPKCDIAHVFNIQTAEESWTAFKKLESRKIPIVLSPIYWDVLEHWFELALDTRALWRYLANVLGRSTVGRMYVAWQRAKSPAKSTWRLQRNMLQRAACVLPNSPSEGDLLCRRFLLNGTFHRRMRIVPNGIDTAMFDPTPAPSHWFKDKYGVVDFILEVGTVSPVKNQLGLIEALYDLPVPIVIVGQLVASKTPEYVEQCKKRGAERGNVIFVDRLPHEELPGVYALAAVHALPSWRETPGLASLEAAACGCRVVTTCIGSTRDYFKDMAHYCHPGDRNSIRVAVEKALEQPRSPALRKHVLENFSWRRAGEATLQAYKMALGET